MAGDGGGGATWAVEVAGVAAGGEGDDARDHLAGDCGTV